MNMAARHSKVNLHSATSSISEITALLIRRQSGQVNPTLKGMQELHERAPSARESSVSEFHPIEAVDDKLVIGCTAGSGLTVLSSYWVATDPTAYFNTFRV